MFLLWPQTFLTLKSQSPDPKLPLQPFVQILAGFPVSMISPHVPTSSFVLQLLSSGLHSHCASPPVTLSQDSTLNMFPLLPSPLHADLHIYPTSSLPAGHRTSPLKTISNLNTLIYSARVFPQRGLLLLFKRPCFIHKKQSNTWTSKHPPFCIKPDAFFFPPLAQWCMRKLKHVSRCHLSLNACLCRYLGNPAQFC